jgi:hypothetical protein
LKPGVDPQNAAQVLGEQITTARNVTGQAGGATLREKITYLRDAYLTWAEDTARRLEDLTFDPEVTSALLTSGSGDCWYRNPV